MSLLRCLAGRYSLVKSSCSDIVSINVVNRESTGAPPTAATPVVVKQYALVSRRCESQMTNSSVAEASPDKTIFGANTRLENPAFGGRYCPIRKGFEYAKTSISSRWRRGRTSGDNQNDENGKCEFNFDSINVRLLETFGVIGTAVAVGIDVWTPGQDRRDAVHHCYKRKYDNFGANVPRSKFEALHRNLNILNGHHFSPCEVIPCCGPCNRLYFDRLLRIYFSSPFLTCSSILHALPKGALVTAISEPKQPQQTEVVDAEKRECIVEDILDDSTYFTSSSAECDSSKSEEEIVSSNEEEVEDKCVSSPREDLISMFKLASVEYSDQMNNVTGYSLMKMGKRKEAMQCWASCDASSRAFFNMGVAYEYGCYDYGDEPDLNRAHDCYALAASFGHAEAIYNLSLFYLYGKGTVGVDNDRAISLLRLAASKGIEQAKNFIIEYEAERMNSAARERLRKRINGESLKQSLFRQSCSSLESAELLSNESMIGESLDLATGTLRRVKSEPNLLASAI